MSLTLKPATVVRIAEALDVDPYGLTAGRLLEEVTARAAERSSGSPPRFTGGRAARELAEEELALSDAWLAHHGLEPLPGDDGRAFLRYPSPLDDDGTTFAPYTPGDVGDEEALWRLHAASHGLPVDDGSQRSLAAGSEEEALWEAVVANLGLGEGERP